MSRSLSEVLEDLNDFAKNVKLGGEEGNRFKTIIGELSDSVDSFSRGLDYGGTALENFSNLSIKSSSTVKGMVEVLKSANSSIGSFSNSVKGLAEVFGMGFVIEPFTQAISDVSSLITNVGVAANELVEAYDGIDKGTRELLGSQQAYAASLGLNFSQAEKNVEIYQELIKTNSDFADAGIYFNSEDFKNGIKALQAAGIAMEELADSSGVAAGGMSNIQAMTMQAKAMGMDISDYSRKMAGMVRTNGISIEDSMKLMASSQEIAKNTGLKVDEVTASLEGATNGFQRMGATMDFARPVLKGFSESIKDVGLGITQAGDLAQDFSKSLLGIANNPALAYITAMKGGFAGSMGGAGGILNPSIQMQALMLNQDSGSQAELARNLSTGMRETLKSFTGGDIITVKEAAAGGAETQSRFYAQQQMLGSVFGISDTTTQSRVLEYLSDLEKATAEGDQEQIDKINEQIAEATKGNDKTLGLQEKMSLSLDKSVVLLQEMVNTEKSKLIAQGFDKNVMGLISQYTTISERLLKDPKDEASKQELEEIKKKLNKANSAGQGTAEIPQPSGGASSAASSSPMGTSPVAQGSQPIGGGGNNNLSVNLSLILSGSGASSTEVTLGSVDASPGATVTTRTSTR